MRLLALTVDDLLREIDYGSESRSHRCTANLFHFYPDSGTLDFVTRSSGSKNSWYQRVVVQDWELLDEEARKINNWDQLRHEYPEAKDLDVKVMCQCPAFAFMYAYIADNIGVGEETGYRYNNAPHPEGRPPNLKNKNLEGVICKHLIAVLRRYFV